MRIINDSHSLNPYFNLAAEEYLLNHTQEDICRFWQNENTVVIGKHQAMPAEVNTKVAFYKDIKIARRISGGGTVFHDTGNLNFTFIKNNPNGQNLIDFKQFTQPIIDALKVLGLTVEHSGRNDLLLNGFKISGNAEHLSQKLHRTLHHGTLLFNSNLNNLGDILKTPIAQFEGKFVQSKRSKVVNICEYLPTAITMEHFRNHLVNYFNNNLAGNLSPLSAKEIIEIEQLANQKYSTIDWIKGYSPKFTFNGIYNNSAYHIQVEKGRIIGYKTTDAALEKAIEKSIGSFFSYADLQNNGLLCNVIFN